MRTLPISLLVVTAMFGFTHLIVTAAPGNPGVGEGDSGADTASAESAEIMVVASVSDPVLVYSDKSCISLTSGDVLPVEGTPGLRSPTRLTPVSPIRSYDRVSGRAMRVVVHCDRGDAVALRVLDAATMASADVVHCYRSVPDPEASAEANEIQVALTCAVGDHLIGPRGGDGNAMPTSPSSETTEPFTLIATRESLSGFDGMLEIWIGARPRSIGEIPNGCYEGNAILRLLYNQ